MRQQSAQHNEAYAESIRHTAIAFLCVLPSVHVYVTNWCCVKTTQPIVMQLTPKDSEFSDAKDLGEIPMS